MKHACNMIRDLLPLYIDDVCSEESKTAVEEHLAECGECRKIYASMKEACGTEEDLCEENCDTGFEQKKADSFRTVKKKIFKKQIITAVIAVVVLLIAGFSTVNILQGKTEVVQDEGNLSVSMTDGNLVGRLQGSRESNIEIKRVILTINGQEHSYLFFCVSETKWDAIATGSELFSEFTLCESDKGAADIDAVYYFTGDYTGLENKTEEQLKEVAHASSLLWSKGGTSDALES